MIERIGSTYAISCDICGIEVENFDYFYEAYVWKKDKSNGWISRQKKDEWFYICPECQKSDAMNEFKGG